MTGLSERSQGTHNNSVSSITLAEVQVAAVSCGALLEATVPGAQRLSSVLLGWQQDASLSESRRSIPIQQLLLLLFASFFDAGERNKEWHVTWAWGRKDWWINHSGWYSWVPFSSLYSRARNDLGGETISWKQSCVHLNKLLNAQRERNSNDNWLCGIISRMNQLMWVWFKNKILTDHEKCLLGWVRLFSKCDGQFNAEHAPTHHSHSHLGAVCNWLNYALLVLGGSQNTQRKAFNHLNHICHDEQAIHQSNCTKEGQRRQHGTLHD